VWIDPVTAQVMMTLLRNGMAFLRFSCAEIALSPRSSQ
jgi:hypothetical protein